MFSFASASVALLSLAAFVSATNHEVTVGAGGQLAFNPEAISANPGDTVTFVFNPKNHTVTQSSLAAPCTPLDGGVSSGFMPVPANQTDNFPTFTISVNDTKPIWVHCEQAANTAASHCGHGMIFAVNCGQDGAVNSFTNFKAAALSIGAALASSSAAAAPSSVAAPSATSPAAVAYTTAAYGTATIPAAPTGAVVTATVSLDSQQWTTTYSSYPGSPAPTPAALNGTIHTVVVGGSSGSLTYSPSFVAAAPRDIVRFEFQQKNHTATQSTFDAPCLKKEGGFDSGFMAVAANVTSGFPTFDVLVNDTTPVWVYCRQHSPDGSSHCGAGMVFAINSVESSTRNFSAFASLAATLNGTNSTGAASSGNSSSSGTGSDGSSSSGASSTMAVNAALGLGSLFAIVAALL